MDKLKARSSNRLKPLAAAALVIAAGTTLRLTGYEAGLPYAVVKYGGSLLWGAMVYLLVTAALPAQPRLRILVSLIIAMAVELFRLYHTPWLDAFRLTLAGALLLGRIFSVWNIVAYIAGIAVAAAIAGVRRQ
ncbi:ribosomal maturation YjgA family protein [Rhizobium sp. CAU 1783]